MSAPPTRCEVAIVGAGASGAAVAWRLAGAGFNVVVLDRGDWWDPSQTPSAAEDWEWRRLTDFSPSPNVRGRPDDDPVDDAASDIKALMVSGVGGSTVMWSCHMPRFHPSDFAMRTLDGVGDDWPITYDELAPYYALNERQMGVAGLAGDPAYPPMPERQTPPIGLNETEMRVAEAFDRLGWAWWPADIAINSAPYAGRGACNNCGPCELLCPRGAKASADMAYAAPAVRKGARILTGARVSEVTLGANGKADGVLWTDGAGREHHLAADRVVVAANGIGTPRLLLMSRSRQFPDGLANRSGLVGRRLMLHPLARVTGRFEPPVGGHRGFTAGGIVSHAFYESDAGRGFVRGVKLLVMRSHGPLLTALGSMMPRIPWGKHHHARFEEVFDHTLSVSICADDLPDEANAVTLSKTLSDADGRPVAAVAYRLGENSRRALAFGRERGRELLEAVGAKELSEVALTTNAGFHLMGTARMGDDPQTSVTDRWGACHDVPNLWIVDGSLFVTAAAVNPTHTLQALALRAADRIAATRQAA
ncbi:MAG: GMC family oxidoreductase [Devosia sp.]